MHPGHRRSCDRPARAYREHRDPGVICALSYLHFDDIFLWIFITPQDHCRKNLRSSSVYYSAAALWSTCDCPPHGNRKREVRHNKSIRHQEVMRSSLSITSTLLFIGFIHLYLALPDARPSEFRAIIVISSPYSMLHCSICRAMLHFYH